VLSVLVNPILTWLMMPGDIRSFKSAWESPGKALEKRKRYPANGKAFLDVLKQVCSLCWRSPGGTFLKSSVEYYVVTSRYQGTDEKRS
jgi:hypothetical protein